jgi:hypothetical protein
MQHAWNRREIRTELWYETVNEKRCKWENNTKMGCAENRCDGMDWNHLVRSSWHYHFMRKSKVRYWSLRAHSWCLN